MDFQKPVAHILALTLVLGGVLAASPVHAAADAAPRISVVFVEPDKFTDVGYSEAERGSRAILLQLQRFIIDTAARRDDRREGQSAGKRSKTIIA